MAIRAQLTHRIGLLRHVERKSMRLVPHRDRLDERAGRELAPTKRADARAANRRPLRVRDAEPEQQLVRWWQRVERHDVTPRDFGPRRDDEARGDLVRR